MRVGLSSEYVRLSADSLGYFESAFLPETETTNFPTHDTVRYALAEYPTNRSHRTRVAKSGNELTENVR